MRIHADDPDACLVEEVTLDGEPVENPVLADEEAGLVEVLTVIPPDWDGKEWPTLRLHGVVRVILEDS